jgi:uncharacterized protein YegJ (DUF2314 family)
MNRFLPVLAFTGFALLFSGCSDPRPKPETLVEHYDESAINEAIATARSRVDEFIDVLARGDADTFSVNVPITDAKGTEHFWLTEVTYSDGSFTGLIGNDPGIVGNVEFGQSRTVPKEAISDWMFTRGDKIHGGFTIDPLLPSYPKEKAEELRPRLVR